MIDLNRRQFLAGAGATVTALATGLEGLVLGIASDAAPIKKRTVTFEQALGDKTKREEFSVQALNALVGDKEFEKYIMGVYYDHEGKRIQKIPNYREIAGTGGIGELGTQNRSYIFVYGTMFEERPILLGGQRLTIRPSELLCKSALKHEFRHAKDHYHGIKLENGQDINRSNYKKLKPLVLNFVFETRAFVEQLEYSRNIEKPNILDVLTLQFNRLPNAYLYSVHSLISYLERNYLTLNPRNMSDFELVAIENQLYQIKQRIPELAVFPVVQNLYQRFEVK